jgi:hypothetical protein
LRSLGKVPNALLRVPSHETGRNKGGLGRSKDATYQRFPTNVVVRPSFMRFGPKRLRREPLELRGTEVCFVPD